jgi:hypothetical protein
MKATLTPSPGGLAPAGLLQGGGDVPRAAARLGRAPGGQDDHGDGPKPGVLVQALLHRPAVQHGHHHVQQDEVGPPGALRAGRAQPEAGERLPAVAHGHHLVPVALQHEAEQLGHVGLVVGEEDLRHASILQKFSLFF